MGRPSRREALALLYERHYAELVRLAFALTNDWALAEDLAQEAFVRVWRSWGNIRDPRSAPAYLRTSVVNLARRSLRRRLLERRAWRWRGAGDLRSADPGESVDLLRALACLPARKRACVVLRFYLDLSEADTVPVPRPGHGHGVPDGTRSDRHTSAAGPGAGGRQARAISWRVAADRAAASPANVAAGGDRRCGSRGYRRRGHGGALPVACDSGSRRQPSAATAAPPLAVVSRTHLSHGGIFPAAGYGGIWVTGVGVIYRVDPATAQIVATIAIPGIGLKQSHIATGAGAVWVTGRDRGRFGVYRIDPRRNRVTSFIRLPPTPVVVTVAYGRVWVDEPRAGPAVVLRIDPRTNRVSGPPIRVGTGGGWMVAGFGALWVTNGDSNGSVSRINPATGTVTRTLVNIPDVTAAGAGSLWGTGNYGGVHRVDPATGRVTATIGRPKNAVRVVFWAGSAWVSAEPPGTLIRIDPASNRIAGKLVPAGTSPIYITAAPSGLWVVDFTAGDLLHLAPTTAVK